MSDLFADMPEHAAPDKPVRVTKKGLYAALPGTGPAGETCGSCGNLSGHTMSRHYHKCALTRVHWTGGGGTDVKVRSPACSKWKAQP
jgi:hypothetical protein